MQQINSQELQEKITGGADIFLADVREPYEHENFNIGGVLIPLGDLMSRANEIPRDKTVVFYCRIGVRSQIAIQRLEERFGFTNLFNLKGGVEKLNPQSK
jgi:adenylyltransferase/sulfurtransferase